MSYGVYAKLIGRDPATEAIVIGPAMHAIGAVCLIRQLPVAPLYWVERQDRKDSSVFEHNALERHFVRDSGCYDLMYVVAREYRYSHEEFEKVGDAMKKLLAAEKPEDWSPHQLWEKAFCQKPKGGSVTFFERAMARYRELHKELANQRRR